MDSDKDNLRGLTRIRPEDLVKGAVRLVSLPDVFVRVTRMVDDPRASGTMIARVIGEDPALTARLLRIANSPLYGFPARIDTISRAIAVIGTRGLRDLVLAYAAIDVLSRFKDGLIDMRAFWRRSLLCALVARLLGVRSRVVEAESLFVAGLLHDIGQLVIANKLPEMAREVHLRAGDGMACHLLERAVIGFDHAEVGGELLRQWQLPEQLWEPVRCHHAPGEARQHALIAALVHIAAVVAAHPYPTDLTPQDETALAHCLAAEVDPVAWAVANLNADVVISLYRDACAQLAPLADTMLPKAA
ncbi:MAG: HDOD domain-containing protein [Rhodanobacteraceae bacterium]|nr:HDOD domain-containing protein [Rhodanobacteraceae bacterium]